MAKLTLSVAPDVVERAKRYASHRDTSVSHLVEQYLRLVTEPAQVQDREDTPVLARLRGVLKGTDLDVADYRRHLEREYR
jgi:hypothetical protein